MWASDTRGTVTVEYVVVLAAVTLVCSITLAGLGVPLYRAFQEHVSWLLLPVP